MQGWVGNTDYKKLKPKNRNAFRLFFIRLAKKTYTITQLKLSIAFRFHKIQISAAVKHFKTHSTPTYKLHNLILIQSYLFSQH